MNDTFCPAAKKRRFEGVKIMEFFRFRQYHSKFLDFVRILRDLSKLLDDDYLSSNQCDILINHIDKIIEGCNDLKVFCELRKEKLKDAKKTE